MHERHCATLPEILFHHSEIIPRVYSLLLSRVISLPHPNNMSSPLWTYGFVCSGHFLSLEWYVMFCVWLLTLRSVFKAHPRYSLDQYFLPINWWTFVLVPFWVMMVNAATALHKILVSGALCFMGWSKKEGHSKVQLRFHHSREEQFLPGRTEPQTAVQRSGYWLLHRSWFGGKTSSSYQSLDLICILWEGNITPCSFSPCCVLFAVQ